MAAVTRLTDHLDVGGTVSGHFSAGVTLSGRPPDGLALRSSGWFDNSGSTTSDTNMVAYQQDGCQAILNSTNGYAATYDAIAISAGAGLATTNGRPGVLIQWADSNGQSTVMWSCSSGSSPRLQGQCANIPALGH